MKRMLLYTVALLSFASAASMPFVYDRAMSALQRGNLDQATQLIKPVVVHNVDDPGVLYDAGEIAYAKKEYAQAKGYFEQAGKAEKATAQLKAQSYFNLANTLVALQDLQGAIMQYEKSLELQESEPARHNLEKVKEMLKKQEEEKKQQEQEKKEQDKEKKEQEQNKQGGQEQNGDGEQKSDQQKQKNKDEGKKQQDEKKRQQEQQQKPQEQDKKEKQQETDEQKEPSQEKDEQQQKQQEDDKQKEKQAQQANNEQKQVKEKQQQQAQNGGSGKKGPMDAQEWLDQMLEASEKRDAHANKELIKATVNKKMAGSHDQNCW